MEAITINLADVYEQLSAPFPVECIELKPGATTKDKTKALALAYCDSRAYQDRLDSIVGPDNWSLEYRPLPGGTGLICRLTLLGVTREDVGECETSDANAATSAAAQAFKRACCAFGLGRYLYRMPQVWVAYDQERKVIANQPEVVRDIYRKAGLLETRQRAA